MNIVSSGEVEKLTTDQLIRWRGRNCAKARSTKKNCRQASHRETPDDDDARRARKATANRITAMHKAALNRAFFTDRVSSDSAWRKVKPFKRVDEAVVRYLSVPEVRRLVNAQAISGNSSKPPCIPGAAMPN